MRGKQSKNIYKVMVMLFIVIFILSSCQRLENEDIKEGFKSVDISKTDYYSRIKGEVYSFFTKNQYNLL